MASRMEQLAARSIVGSGLLERIERAESRVPKLLRILVYHRVDWPATTRRQLDPSLLSATPESFERQMAYLARNYCVVTIDEVLAAVRRDTSLPPAAALVTFDDGYSDFLTQAWPVLERLRLPATLFVPTDYLDEFARRFWWDRLYTAFMDTSLASLNHASCGRYVLADEPDRLQAYFSVKQRLLSIEHHRAMQLVDDLCVALAAGQCDPHQRLRDTLTWNDVRQLACAGLSVGAHTQSHPVLSRVALGAAQREILGSRRAIERELGCVRPIFSYPCGHQHDICTQVIGILFQAGFWLGMTSLEGHNRIPACNPLRLRRVGLAAHVSLDEFRLCLTGFYNVYGRILALRQKGTASTGQRNAITGPASGQLSIRER